MTIEQQNNDIAQRCDHFFLKYWMCREHVPKMYIDLIRRPSQVDSQYFYKKTLVLLPTPSLYKIQRFDF